MFRTRLPVASLCIATELLPHDLHVLSLPLAFILSQDQTLHRILCEIIANLCFYLTEALVVILKSSDSITLILFVLIFR